MQKHINAIADRNGKPVAGASVLVLNYPSGTTATIYSDNGTSPQSNPVTTDINGAFSFYAADGRYSLQISGPSFPTRKIDDIMLEDPADGGLPGSATLTDGASIAWNTAAGQMAFLSMSTTQTARTLANPTNIQAGVTYKLLVKNTLGGQDFSAFGDKIVALTDLSVSSGVGAVTAFEFFTPDGVTLYAAKMGAGTATTTNAPSGPTAIAVADWPNVILQSSDYWSNEDIWGATGLTRGPYTGINGTTYEQQIGFASPRLNPASGAVSARFTWKYPTGTTEVKAYPSIIAGNKPGWYQASAPNPAGYNVILPDGSTSTTSPSGKTPNSIFPLALPVTSLKSRFAYTNNQTPTGRGHLTYDIWLQNTGTQGHGFAAPPITTEIMIPLYYWGNYGAYVAGGGGRNPGWYVGDATIDGLLWHCYFAPTFNGAWVFIVFEPDGPVPNRQLNLAAFINYAVSQGWTAGGMAMGGGATSTAATHVVSVELGIEPVDGTGDLTLSAFDVTL